MIGDLTFGDFPRFGTANSGPISEDNTTSWADINLSTAQPLPPMDRDRDRIKSMNPILGSTFYGSPTKVDLNRGSLMLALDFVLDSTKEIQERKAETKANNAILQNEVFYTLKPICLPSYPVP